MKTLTDAEMSKISGGYCEPHIPSIDFSIPIKLSFG